MMRSIAKAVAGVAASQQRSVSTRGFRSASVLLHHGDARNTGVATMPTSFVVNDLNWTWRSVVGRGFSTSSEDSANVNMESTEMDENRFMEIAEDALENIMTWLEGIEEMLEESDISLSQGVLNIDLGEHGTWVINRQIPNRQIWWSSPISGPRRYEYNSATKTWHNTRDQTELMELLQDEISEATGISIFQ